METVLLLVAGAVWVALVIAVTRMLTRWVGGYMPWMRENVVYAFVLISTAYQYVQWAQAGATADAVSTEAGALAFFAAFAIAGLRWPVVLALGWLLHGGWDWALHPMPDTRWVPSWFPTVCVGYDVVLAAYIAARARGWAPRRASALRATVAGVLLAGMFTASTVSAQEHDHGHHQHATEPPAAPVGEPALGPSAFMHRLSALENPLLPLSHDTQDSTHQTRDVLTAGIAYKNVHRDAAPSTGSR